MPGTKGANATRLTDWRKNRVLPSPVRACGFRWRGLDGIKPAGDDVVTPATVAATSNGCKFTKNTLGPDESRTTKALRPAILANSVPCPAI